MVPLPGTDLHSYTIKHNLIKDEVDYHMNLDSDYNFYSSVNLTQWTNSEFVRKRRRLRNKINNYYYRSHKKEFLYDQYHKFIIYMGELQFIGNYSKNISTVKRKLKRHDSIHFTST